MNDTREYIIDQAYGLFLNSSYEGVSISEISKAIGLTKGALYHHFVNKEELFMAVIDKYLIITEVELVETEATFQQFIDLCIAKAQEIIHQALNTQQPYVPLNILALFIDAFRHYPDFASKKGNLIEAEIKKTKNILEHGIRKGEIRKDLNTSVMAEIFFTVNLGVVRSLIHSNVNAKLAIEQLRVQLLEFYKLVKA